MVCRGVKKKIVVCCGAVQMHVRPDDALRMSLNFFNFFFDYDVALRTSFLPGDLHSPPARAFQDTARKGTPRRSQGHIKISLAREPIFFLNKL